MVLQDAVALIEIATPIVEEMGQIGAAIAEQDGVPTDAQIARLAELRSQLDTAGGGDFLARVLELQTVISPNAQVDLVPTKPIPFVAINGGIPVVRGRTDALGTYNITLRQSPEGVSLFFFDPTLWALGVSNSRSLLPGRTQEMPDYLLSVSLIGAEDFDGDGLPDIAEFVLGTSPSTPDTDRDGVLDGAELQAGTNPLDGLPAATGILASADTPGNAIDVCAVNDVAIVADSGSGVTVFNVTAGQAPTAVAQITTPGSAQAVSCTGNLIAVADGSAGLTIIDITDPPAAKVVREIVPLFLGSGSAQAIASAADLALVGTTGGIVSMVQIDTGVVLDKIDLGGPVQDLAIEGETLYAYANGKLQTLSFLRGPLTLLGSVNSPGAPVGRGRIFVGGGVAYLTKSTGFNTFDVSDPANPSILASGASGQRAWQDIVTNGSGTGVTAVGPFGLNNNVSVSLYDTSDPTVTDLDNQAFLTTFPTPGVARAVTLFNGQAFLADGTFGLQVVNYKAFDTGTTPPTGSMSSNVAEATVVEGRRIVLTADVADDVQVRSVEFKVDGTRIVADGDFPFETAFRIPLGQVGGTMTFTGTASDTGGNILDLGPIALTVAGDTEPPTVQIDDPAEGDVFFVHDVVGISATALDNVEVVSLSFQLDGAPFVPRRVSLFAWEFDAPTALGSHILVAQATDTAGNTGASSPVTFLVKDQVTSRMFTVFHDLINPVQIKDVVSRDFTVRVVTAAAVKIADVTSRIFTVFHDLINPVRIGDVVSREFTVDSVQPAP